MSEKNEKGKRTGKFQFVKRSDLEQEEVVSPIPKSQEVKPEENETVIEKTVGKASPLEAAKVTETHELPSEKVEEDLLSLMYLLNRNSNKKFIFY